MEKSEFKKEKQELKQLKKDTKLAKKREKIEQKFDKMNIKFPTCGNCGHRLEFSRKIGGYIHRGGHDKTCSCRSPDVVGQGQNTTTVIHQ